MIFLGQGIVKYNNRTMIFIDGEYEAQNEMEIMKLESLGFQVKGEVKPEYKPVDSLSWDELKELAKDRGISLHKKTKEDLIKELQ